MDVKFKQKALSQNAVDFINDVAIRNLINNSKPDAVHIREIIAKSLSKQALSVEETARLLAADQPDLVQEIFEGARRLKREVYGNRIVIFAPLYIGNKCVNDCGYCGFKSSNSDCVRRTLSDDDLKRQVLALESRGQKRLILVFGEHPEYGPEFIAKSVRTAYATKTADGKGEIRRVNINAAPLDIEGYKIVKAAGIGTYQIFQETYDHEAYAKFHPAHTRKGDYLWRLDGLSRAFEAGIDDVGIGALFGLADWKFDVLGLVTHALYLQERYHVGPHTISFPRLRPASGTDVDQLPKVSDNDFKRVVAILRLAVPYTGMILTAREPASIRRELMAFGVSQIDAGSRIELGGYTEAGDSLQQAAEKEQFELGDIRSLDEVMRELVADGYLPSFCTACYRLGRTGEHFMEFAIPGFIKRYCAPNACSTLMEYLVDYASPETRAVGEKAIRDEIETLTDPALKAKLLERIEQIKNAGKRDLYF
ncbi:MAG: [FeFe] hydrogenase H-cluster radical SAM maturase HydG [Planctomycetota bacterium]